ncbi:MAG: N-acetylmuramoyl-L-alanine amidase [Deltaproteobacteria bacterium]|nr:N-acetylmuramoyl-L-alanine amidase [Deltaproteobacteria bacterium]
MDGNFEKQQPSDAQLQGLVRVLAWGSQQYGVEPEAIGVHRDFAATLCPGKHLLDRVKSGEIARRVGELRATTDMALVVLDDDAGKAGLPVNREATGGVNAVEPK